MLKIHKCANFLRCPVIPLDSNSNASSIISFIFLLLFSVNFTDHAPLVLSLIVSLNIRLY